eukprot:SAG11_NODE_6995_length_1211_cov_3.409173_2_plen_116_part_00
MAERIAALLAGEKPQREQAYGELSALGRSSADADRDAALACVAPLMESVFTQAAAAVDAEELQRAHVLLGELALNAEDPLPFCLEFNRENRFSLGESTINTTSNLSWLVIAKSLF